MKDGEVHLVSCWYTYPSLSALEVHLILVAREWANIKLEARRNKLKLRLCFSEPGISSSFFLHIFIEIWGSISSHEG